MLPDYLGRKYCNDQNWNCLPDGANSGTCLEQSKKAVNHAQFSYYLEQIRQLQIPEEQMKSGNETVTVTVPNVHTIEKVERFIA